MLPETRRKRAANRRAAKAAALLNAEPDLTALYDLPNLELEPELLDLESYEMDAAFDKAVAKMIERGEMGIGSLLRKLPRKVIRALAANMEK